MDNIELRLNNIKFLKNKINLLFDKINQNKFNTNDINNLNLFQFKCEKELSELLDIVINIINQKNFEYLNEEYKEEIFNLMIELREILND